MAVEKNAARCPFLYLRPRTHETIAHRLGVLRGEDARRDAAAPRRYALAPAGGRPAGEAAPRQAAPPVAGAAAGGTRLPRQRDAVLRQEAGSVAAEFPRRRKRNAGRRLRNQHE